MSSNPIPLELLSDNASISDSGELLIAGCALTDLAEEFGTPLFVYDQAHIEARCREALDAFPDGATYAAKAFFCLSMARLVSDAGMNIDVASGGELYVALSAGVPAKKLIFHGNNKSVPELLAALKAGVGYIVLDSFDELDRLEKLSAELKVTPKVIVRITPGVSAHTHKFISTGQDDTKFGFTVSSGLADKAVQRASNSQHLDLQGIHAHIGSQIFSLENLGLGATKLAEFAAKYNLPELSVGGGLGVAYVEGETAPSITQWGEVVKYACEKAGLKSKITAEPGRSIVANSAVTLYSVGTIKDLPDIRTYVSVDGGMSDNPRPVLYGSGYETFLPRAAGAKRPRKITLVGMHCESGDVLVEEGQVPEDLEVGDVLATPVTGAYGHTMSSNYNKVRRPAVVFVANGVPAMVVKRETHADLLSHDEGPRAILDSSLEFNTAFFDTPFIDPDDFIA